MRVLLLSITQGIFISSTLLGNISSIENNFIYSFIVLNQDTTFESNQDTTFEDSISIISKSNISNVKNKAPGKAMLYSAVLPGLGQVYMGKWKRGLIYLALEGIAAGVWYQNNILAEERKIDYESYAAKHWHFAHWIHDYYKWHSETPHDNFSGTLDDWNSIRAVFLNNTGDYSEIWSHTHNVKFSWYEEEEGKVRIVSSSSAKFEEKIFNELCEPINYICANDIDAINGIMIDKSVDVKEDHDFYEGIQKYDSYFAGWEDNDLVEVTDKGDNDKNVTSPIQREYQSIYTDYNDIKKIAGAGTKFMLINRFVSMIDGLFLAKKWNADKIVNFNLDLYPDLRNKLGVGGVKLTMQWK